MTPAGIIAAGEGSRLRSAGAIKPLVKVAGKPLVDWIVSALGASDVTLLHNSRGKAVPAHLRESFPAVRFDFVQADTASSFESFRLVSLRLAEKHESFLISTVDALIPPQDVSRFLRECRDSRADAGLALTAHVDDEKPLWADVDELGLVVAVGDDAGTRRRVTSGLYYMTRAAAARLPSADAHSRLRDYWRQLVRSGARVAGPALSKTLDIDRPEDLAAAETFLLSEMKR